MEFAEEVRRRYPDFHMPAGAMSFESPDAVDLGPYRVYFVKYIYPVPGKYAPVSGDTLMTAAHPQTFLPFLYEGYSPQERSVFLSTDFSMRVVKTR
jgi:hypothetical protein